MTLYLQFTALLILAIDLYLYSSGLLFDFFLRVLRALHIPATRQPSEVCALIAVLWAWCLVLRSGAQQSCS